LTNQSIYVISLTLMKGVGESGRKKTQC